MKVFPLVSLIILDSKRFTFTVRENKSYWKCVPFDINASMIAEGQRPIYGRVCDGPPEVDDLEASFKEFLSIGGGEMSVDSRDGGGGGLIDMNSCSWLTKISRVGHSRTAAA